MNYSNNNYAASTATTSSTTTTTNCKRKKYSNYDNCSISSRDSLSTKATKESKDCHRLKQQNARMVSEIEELRLELTYYRGEVKRLDLDNQFLTKEVDKLSSIFNGWLNNNCRGNVADNPYHLSTIIKLPPKHIKEILLCKQDQSIVLASCQPPFHIEYANKYWSEVCGWDVEDILGLTCAFLQGEDTDMEIVNAFAKDIQQTAYARMRIHNYNSKGNKFATTVTVFPIYDSIAHTGPDSDIPVLTHLCAVHSDVVYIGDTDDKVLSNGIYQALSPELARLAERKGLPMKSAERLSKACKFSTRCSMDTSAFLKFATNIRLSDLLRFMLTCESPLLLLDENDLIVHTNTPWTTAFGYALRDVEGMHKSILYGPSTSDDDKTGCDSISMRMKNFSKTGYYYTKSGVCLSCHTGTVPIIGGYLNPDVTHFCVMFVPIEGQGDMQGVAQSSASPMDI